jgi:hypothetical protein
MKRNLRLHASIAGMLSLSILAGMSLVPTSIAAANEQTITSTTQTPSSSVIPGGVATDGMPAVITELAIKTSNGQASTPSADYYNLGEFIEITNVSDEPLPISDLTLNYNGVDWTPEAFDAAGTDSAKNVDIPVKKSVVLWSNYKNASRDDVSPNLKSAEDFNNYWEAKSGKNPDVVMGSSLFTISKGDGMANSSKRTLVLSQKSTGATSTVTYDDGGALNDRTLNFTYSADGTASATKGNTATPGILEENQLPASWPKHLHRKISIEDTSQLPQAPQGSDKLQFSAKVVSSDGQAHIGSVRLLIKTNSDDGFKDSKADGIKSGDGMQWSFTLGAGALVSATSFTYRFVVTDTDKVTFSSTDKLIHFAESGQQQASTSKIPLVITELAVDTKNVGSADGYEFIEVTNVSDKNIDFSKNYTIYYSYPDKGEAADVEWGPDQKSITIERGSSIVFWIKNGANDELTDSDFNANYGLTGASALSLGKNLFTINSAGMANAAARDLKITTKTRTLISSASYAADSAKLSGASNSLQYVYTGSGNTATLARTNQVPTPGTISQSDVPANPYAYPSSSAPVSVVDASSQTLVSGKNFDFSFTVTSAGALVSRVLLFTRTDSGDYTEHNLTATAGSDDYTFEMNAIDLIRKKTLEYYVVASDEINADVTTQKNVLTNQGVDLSPVRLNVEDGSLLRSKVALRATGPDSAAVPEISIDGGKIDDSETSSSLESEPYIAADITQTDIFFFNSFTKKTVISGTPQEDDWKNNIIGYNDDGTYGASKTISYPVPFDTLTTAGGTNVMSMYLNAGTKSSATDILDEAGTVNSENADNYLASNIRLALPDGTTLRVSKATAAVSPGAEGQVTMKDVTEEIKNPTASIKMGDSAGQYEYIKLDFTVEPTSFTTSLYQWDTTKETDGKHEVSAHLAGLPTKTVSVTVDNTVPTISPEITAQGGDDTVKRGAITIDASTSDATSGIAESGMPGALEATLADGGGVAKAIALPFATSSTQLPAGKHTVTFIVSDKAGNAARKVVTFTTPTENPSITATSSSDGVQGSDKSSAKLSVSAKSESNDLLHARFYAGQAYNPLDSEMSVSEGTTNQQGPEEGKRETLLSQTEKQKMKAPDSESMETTADDGGFPYQKFEITVPDSLASDAAASVRAQWSGSANASADLYLFVRNMATGKWEQVARTQANSEGKASFDEAIANKDHLDNGTVHLVVQNGNGYAASTDQSQKSGAKTSPATLVSADQSDNSLATSIKGAHGNPVITMQNTPISQEALPRSDYDFTFAWESDTQYYNANYDNDGFYQHQKNIHDFLLNNREKMNIQYMFHTGDIVDNADIADQWTRADEQYSLLDKAKLPYGVLAGNHDVDHKTEDYTNYSKYFGESRYSSNPWYGGSYKDNRCHYDLMSAGGTDFVMLYCGWGVGDDEIDWMNQVLASYPNRVAILDFHEYLLASGGLGLIPQEVYKRVVVPNANVKMVMSGHYHSAQKTVSTIDMDGDGTADRNVVNLLFDYQGMEEGGMGFLRLFHFNMEAGQMEVRTYSPSIDKYGSQTVASSSFTPGDEEFSVDLTQLGIKKASETSVVKTMATDSMEVSVLSTALIGETDMVVGSQMAASEKFLGSSAAPSAQMAVISWGNAPIGSSGWYAVVTNPYGGIATSEVSSVTVSSPGSDSPTETNRPQGKIPGKPKLSAHSRPVDRLAATGLDVGWFIVLIVMLGAGWSTSLTLRKMK